MHSARTWWSVLGVVSLAIILASLNAIADRNLASAQIDLTQEQIYTLSPGTRKVLAGLSDPVTLRLFYSPQLGASVPIFGAYADRVREMLRRYAAASDGKLKVETYDPESFSNVEDRAIGYGLQGVPIDRTGEQVYFGLAGTNLVDDERTIAFFQPPRERFLEYDLTRLVHELSDPKRPVVGVMSSLPLDGDQRAMMRGQPGGSPYVSMVQLRQAFDVRRVASDALVIDPDIQVMLVAQAQDLSPPTLYALDQFVMRGGRLMAMVDPHSEAEAAQVDQSGVPRFDTAGDLKPLLAGWGVGFDPETVIGDPEGAWRVRTAPGERVQAVDYLAWYNIRSGIAHDDPATADLQQVTVASPGAITRTADSAITLTPLLNSSAQSGTIPAAAVRLQPDPVAILAGFRPQGGPRVIAARAHGVLHSAFAAPPDLPEGRQRPAGFPAHIAATSGPADFVVVADTDILVDRFWVRIQDFFGQQAAAPFSDNGAFLVNVVGTLAGGDALLGLRGRGGSLRPLERIEAIQRDAEARFRQTEQQLQSHLADTNRKLADLRAGRDPAAANNAQSAGAAARAVITAEQRQAVDELTRDVGETRGKLRRVQLELRRDVSTLETRLRLLNIVLVPVLLVLGAVVLAILRRRYRAGAAAGARA